MSNPSVPRILSMVDISACPNVLDALRDIADVVEAPDDQQVYEELIANYDAFLTPLTIQSHRAALDNSSRLRVIATASTGLDHIDIPYARSREVEVISLKDDVEFLNGLTATAELAWALLLSTVRRLPAAVNAAVQGEWARDRFRGYQLSGKTLGVVGYGRLGKMVAEYGKAFRMRVLVCDRKPVEPDPGIEQVEFQQLVGQSDVVSIHIHLTDENRNLFNAEAFASMKPTAVLINTSRGAIINEGALLAALETGRIQAAGLDVIDGEWRDDLKCHPLIRYANVHDNLVISPHIGGVTYESQGMAYGRIVEKLVQYLRADTK